MGKSSNSGDTMPAKPADPFWGSEASPREVQRPTHGTFEGFGVAVNQDPVARANRGEVPQPDVDPPSGQEE